MPLLYQFDRLDSAYDTYLRLYGDYIEIKKPKQSKYEGE